MNYEEALTAVRQSLIAERDALAGVHMERPAEAVIARGRARRLRRRLVQGMSGVAAAGAVLALVLALTLGGIALGTRQMHVNLTDWSVNTNRNGTVTVKIRELGDSARLQHVLKNAGIPALVRWGELCLAPRSQYLPTRGIVDGPDYVGGIVHPVWIRGEPYANEIWTFSPSRMPPDARYMITAIPLNQVPRNRGGMTWGLIRDSAHLTCTKNPGAS